MYPFLRGSSLYVSLQGITLARLSCIFCFSLFIVSVGSRYEHPAALLAEILELVHTLYFYIYEISRYTRNYFFPVSVFDAQ